MKQITAQKTVNYFGIDLIVPDEYGFLATDKGGSVYWYEERPEFDKSQWDTDASVGSFLCGVDLEGMDWRESLMEVK